MAIKNLYIRKGDESFWLRAEQLAKADGVSLSVWVTRLIQNRIYADGTGQVEQPTPAELLREISERAARVSAMLELAP